VLASPTCPFIGPFSDFTFGFSSDGGAHISYVAVNPSNPIWFWSPAQIPGNGIGLAGLTAGGVYCSEMAAQPGTAFPPRQEEMASFVGFATLHHRLCCARRRSRKRERRQFERRLFFGQCRWEGQHGFAGSEVRKHHFHTNVTATASQEYRPRALAASIWPSPRPMPAARRSTLRLPTPPSTLLRGARGHRAPTSAFSKTTNGGATWTNTNAPPRSASRNVGKTT